VPPRPLDVTLHLLYYLCLSISVSYYR